MRCWASASAARAVFEDADRSFFVNVESPDVEYDIVPNMLRFVLNEAVDVVELQDITKPAALEALRGMCRNDRALRLLQLVVDPRETNDVRREAIAALDVLLQSEATMTTVLRRCFGWPLSHQTSLKDLEGLFGKLFRSAELVVAVIKHQPEIRKVRESWSLAVAPKFADSAGALARLELAAIDRGAFQALASAIHLRAPRTSIEPTLHTLLGNVSGADNFAGDWIGSVYASITPAVTDGTPSLFQGQFASSSGAKRIFGPQYAPLGVVDLALERTYEKIRIIRDHLRQFCLHGDHLPVSIDDLKWVISERYSVEVHIHEIAAVRKGFGELRAILERWPDAVTRIFIPAGLSTDEARFAIATELCHIVIDQDEDFSTDARKSIVELLGEWKRLHSGAPDEPIEIKAGWLAELAASEILYPFAYRERDARDLAAGLATEDRVARFFSIPSYVVTAALTAESLSRSRRWWSALSA